MFYGVEDEDEPFIAEAVKVPIDGTLDLHTFQPRELKTLLPDYFQACRDKNIYDVRIVHGKGTGALRRSVHALLNRMEGIESYRLGGMGEGSWGATLVVLKRAAE
tara:strand:+ start:1533 stop:1847 length:315 start_codon:yes stop_codon:yes gene_type:complete